MKKVNVSTFKAKISAYLRSVQKGDKYQILDRNMPIAIVSPNEGAEFEATEPKASFLAAIKAIYCSSVFEKKPRSVDLLRSDRNFR